jgi:hypothetical protein
LALQVLSPQACHVESGRERLVINESLLTDKTATQCSHVSNGLSAKVPIKREIHKQLQTGKCLQTDDANHASDRSGLTSYPRIPGHHTDHVRRSAKHVQKRRCDQHSSQVATRTRLGLTARLLGRLHTFLSFPGRCLTNTHIFTVLSCFALIQKKKCLS